MIPTWILIVATIFFVAGIVDNVLSIYYFVLGKRKITADINTKTTKMYSDVDCPFIVQLFV